MPNGMTQIDTLEYIGVELGAGLAHPSAGVRQGLFFGWAGTSGRSSTGYSALIARFRVQEELLVIAAAANSNTASATLLEGPGLVHVVQGRVTVAIPTAATFNVGDATTAARFASAVAVAVNTTFAGILQWSGAVTTLAAGPSQAASAGIRVTPNLTPGTAAGRVALQTFCELFIPPTA
jgi:hypothetical protein